MLNKVMGLFVLLAAATGIGVYKHYSSNTYQDDNVIEEKVEKVVQLKTGLDMDLTPTSKE